jgi:hypothetical protein
VSVKPQSSWSQPPAGFTPTGAPVPQRLAAELAVEARVFTRVVRMVDDGTVVELRESTLVLTAPLAPGVELVNPPLFGQPSRTVDGGLVFEGGAFRSVHGPLVSGHGPARELALGLPRRPPLADVEVWRRLVELTPVELEEFAFVEAREAVQALALRVVSASLEALGPVKLAERLHALAEGGVVEGWGPRAVAAGLQGFLQALESELEQRPAGEWVRLVAAVLQ